ncbi:hypothetical protein Mycch_2688 [Mycolicibacterium chubuense NBB4]|uniref:Secreted protein n=1 Tax=Mycolicibacterium chubuense (strain NBB4) TaxID=710421 RepID=I4BJJ6_MYCCN|nr:hypothetical protein Mycch_2688 [Mycolicibacterium chubuense NBB4]
MRLAYLVVVPVAIAAQFTVAPPAFADCTSSAGTTVCSQGDVRGANTGHGPGGATPNNPYWCWWCDNGGWGLTFVIERPVRPRDGGGRPGRGGG